MVKVSKIGNVVLIGISLILITVLLYSCKNIDSGIKYSSQGINSGIEYSTLINNQEITLNKIGDYSNVNLNAIIYYIPLSILTRSALKIDNVKRQYRTKIEIGETIEIYNFLKSIDNTVYTIKDHNSLNLRCVVEFFKNDELIFFYSIDAYKDIIIDSHMINNGNEFIEFVTQYLDKIYLRDFYE
jgi:hypothetical protein